MNKIYKIIWSKAKNCYIVVSEIAKRNGKCSSSLNKKIIAAFLAAGTVMSVTGSAWAAEEPLSDAELITLRKLLQTAAVKTSGTVTQATATGDNSVAIGNGANAKDTGNVAIGNGATAEWIQTESSDVNTGKLVAIGSGAKASGAGAVAIGYNTIASDLNAIAMGWGSEATNANTVAMGQEAKATGYQSFAIGTWSEASGSGSTTIGYQSKASNTNATAIGGMTEASGWGAVAIGAGNTNNVDTYPDGTLIPNQAAKASGTAAVSIGNWSKATGEEAVAVGYYSRATANESVAYGYYSLGTEYRSSAFGSYSQALNANATATGFYARATGSAATALGGWSHAEGTNAIATGYLSHAVGENSSAFGSSALANDKNTSAFGLTSTAYGEGSVALGHSTATGVLTKTVQGSDGIYTAKTYTQDEVEETQEGPKVTKSYVFRMKKDGSGVVAYDTIGKQYYEATDGGSGTYTIGAATTVDEGSLVMGGIAIGSYAHVEGDRAMSIGRASGAYGKDSTAIGHYANALGEGSMAIGHGTVTGAEGITISRTDPDDPDSHTITPKTDAYGNPVPNDTYGGIAIGSYSHATGERSMAIGRVSGAYDKNSTAMGLYSNAFGEGAMAIGHNATAGAEVTIAADPNDPDHHTAVMTLYDADGNVSTAGTGKRSTTEDGTPTRGGIAFGSYAHAVGDRAIAFGRASGAYGKNSTAMGIYANALGEGAMAIGHGTVTGAENITISRTDPNDPDSHTITLGLTDGNPVSNDTYGGIAIGSYSHATGERSMAIGRVSGAYNENSTAMGLYSNAFGEGAMAIGHNATAGAEVTIAADPDDPDHRTAVMTLYDANGNVSTSGTGKRSTMPDGTYTQGGIAFGSYAHAVGDRAIAFGRVSGAYGTNSTAMGIYANALGQGAIAMGHGSSAGVTVTVNPSGDEGTAEWADGFWTTTLETNEETGNPVANGNDGGIAIGSYAHTEGTRAMAIGRVAGAYGMNTTVVGLRSNAYGEGSMAFGHGVTAGKDDPDDPLHTRYAKQITELHNNPKLEYDLDGVDPTLVDGKEVRVDHNNVIGAVAMGSYAEATGRGSLSVGRYSKAASAYSTTLGIRAQVLESAENAIAIGREATVGALTEGRTYGGMNSISIGTLTSVKGQNSIAIGMADMLSDDGESIVATAERKPTSVTGDKSIAIGMNDTVEGTSSIAIGTGHTVIGDGSGAIGDPSYIEGDNSYAIGNNNNIAVNDGFILGNNASVTKEGGVALGTNASVTKEGGVALGTNAIASTEKGVAGYDPTTGEASTDEGATWKSTAAAVSVGGGTPTDTKVTVTRQITNVAAGYEDTDAVNVAQLKQAVAAMPVVKSSDESVTVTKSEENGVITFDLSVEGAGTDTTYKMSSKQTDDKGEGTKATVTLTGSDGTSQTVDIVDTNTHTSVIGDGKYISVDRTKEADKDAGPEYTVSLDTSELKKVINTDTSNTVKQGDRITVKEAPNAEGRTEYTISGANIKNGKNIEVAYVPEANEFTVATAADVEFENVEVTNEFKAGDTVINEGGVTTNNIETKNINVTENITYKGDTIDTIVTDVTYAGDSNTLTITKGAEVTEYTLKGNTYKGDNKTINISEDNVVSVIEGTVASDDKGKGVVTGNTVYNEVRVKEDGNYVKKDSTAGENISKLDEQVHENAQNIENMGNAINNTNSQINSLDNRMRKGLAGAAALAALHPMDFNPDDKLQFAAGVGNYRGETAAALGAFYRPDESVMFSIGGTFGNADNMVNAGITFGLDGNKNRITRSRTAMAREIQDLRSLVTQMAARMDRMEAANGIETAMFPDVPENHWAYEYVEDLQKRGALKGYPDGLFKGDRAMTRYEFAAMLDRIVRSGVTLDPQIAKEFEPELGRIYVERISGQDNDRKKIERVRVNNSDSKYPEGKARDVYGSKIQPVVSEKVAGE